MLAFHMSVGELADNFNFSALAAAAFYEATTFPIKGAAVFLKEHF